MDGVGGSDGRALPGAELAEFGRLFIPTRPHETRTAGDPGQGVEMLLALALLGGDFLASDGSFGGRFFGG